MIARIAWYIVLAAVACIATGAQIDRHSRNAAVLADRVPAPFRAFALEQLSVRALFQGDNATALDMAREQLRIRPMPAENLRLFAQASLLGGDQATAMKALSAAGQRGWRDPVVQFAVAAAAANQRNFEVEAQRIAALWATGFRHEQLDAMLADMLSTAEGRRAFATQLANTGRWHDNFFSANIARSHPRAFAQTLIAAEALGADLPCAKLRQVSERLRRLNQQDLLGAIVPQRCASGD